MKELDHLNIDLSGINLIEASAGTGKTYAISCLYLRLLIEKNLLPEQILVVTFTEAATKELRGRIRRRIRELMEALDGHVTTDTFLIGLLKRLDVQDAGRIEARIKLERALNAFDTASIYTIHSFCLHALMENAFESGSLYDTELVKDQSDFLQEIIDDFWRKNFFGESSPLLKCLLQKNYSPKKFINFLQGMLSNPKMEIVPRFSAEETATVEKDCFTAFKAVQKQWGTRKDEIKEIIENDKGLSRSADNYRADLLPDLFSDMDAYAGGDNPFDLFEDFGKFTESGIAKGTKDKGTAPTHEFFKICETLKNNIDKRMLAWFAELITFCRERLPLCKQESNIRFFDDLLNDLYQALYGKSGEALAGNLCGKYHAALIDEFQDTDPVQYDIFKKIYAGTDYPLFLIGDPKQAIYSFRGADIFAYIKASEDVPPDKRFTLTANWRSTPLLLSAFNELFHKTNQFVDRRILYHPLKSGHDASKKSFVLTDGDPAPLQIWIVPPDENGKAINIGRANNAVSGFTATEISRLLNDGGEGKAKIHDRENQTNDSGKSLLPEDIAVIVLTHRQAGSVQDALRELNIPSVVRSDKSVLATEEAQGLYTILNALSDPGNETKIRAALVTAILGRSGDDIANLLDHEHAWEQCLQTFREYHETWLKRGFMAMAQSMLAQEEIRGRLLRYPDGERRLTNLLHCFEIIHRKEHEQKSGMEGIVTWFSERVGSEERSDEYELRLETDEKAVKILTVHISKGLQFPIVFCPFLWGGIKDSGTVISFHRDDFNPVKDFGSDDYEKNKIIAEKESLAENVRLLYVALTRAQYRCYLVAGRITSGRKQNRPETSSISYILHASEETRLSPDPVQCLADEIKTLSPEDMRDQLKTLTNKANDAFSVREMREAGSAVPYNPVTDDVKKLFCREFSGTLSSDWRVTSFSSLASHETAAIEMPDRDEMTVGHKADGESEIKVSDETSIFTFPRGAQAGIFFHEVFEKLNFAGPSLEEINALVEKELEKYGYDSKWKAPVTDMVNAIMNAPIATSEGVLNLGGMKAGSWLTELEFFFPLKYITSDRLNHCLRKWGAINKSTDMNRISSYLNFQPVRGMVRGFMDMVFEHGGKFYLLDWKSNHLGYRIEDYGREAMKKEMERNLYPLQYLLYTVALNRYLSLRIKDYNYATHFGGVLYVFLRGISAGHGEAFGFFRDMPPAQMIDDMTDILIQGHE
ncbi:MAG: exodeoxyribonuclease V subunit beta [Smithella sp.]|nr:exodeoxyribonuclease V subunit beta [Smithella sp.]